MLTSVLQVVADGRPGGGSTVVLALLERLLGEEGWAPALLTQGDSYLARKAMALGVPCLAHDFFDWRLTGAALLKKTIGHRRFGVVHVHGLRAAHRWCAAGLVPAAGPLLYTVHGLHQLHLPWPLRTLANIAERRVLQRVAAHSFVSAADLELARSWRLLSPKGSAELIRNGVDIDRLQGLRLSERETDAIFLGRLVRQKNPELAAAVLAGLALKGWRCALGGAGELERRVRGLLSELPGGPKVRWLGELDHGQALRALAGARLVIMPSRWEGLPLLPMEAMGLKVAVLASKLQACLELMPTPDCGTMLASHDPEDWIAAADGLLGQDLEPMVNSAFAHLCAHHDREMGLAAYMDLYAASAARP